MEHQLWPLSDGHLMGRGAPKEDGGCVPLVVDVFLSPVLETDASNTERSRAGSPTAPVYNESLLGPADSSSSQQSRDTEVLLVELKPGTRYNATVYSQAANGTEGQPQTIEFRTSRLSFVKWWQPEFLSAVFCLL